MSPYVLAWIEFLTGRFFFMIAGAIGMVVYLATLYFSNLTLLPRGHTFRDDVMPRVLQNPMAIAVLLGCRYLAFALFLGCLVLAGASVSIKY